jgi:hypothetical protein
MTMVEVLVASAVSAVVAGGVASMASVGGRVVDLGARQWADAATVATLVDQWPVALAASVDQIADSQGQWWLCGPPGCATGERVAVTAPAGWTVVGVATDTVGDVSGQVTATWQRPDGSLVSLSGRRAQP